MPEEHGLRIGGLTKVSLSDYPGKLCAVVFTAGCGWNCWYCHNRGLIDGEPVIPESEVLAYLERRRGYLDGVAVSGGEPTVQECLADFLEKIQRKGFSVKLDTNGSNPDVVRRLLEAKLLDYAAVDLKAPVRMYRQITGSDGEPVLETIEALRESGIPFEVRTTMIPNIGEAELTEMMREAGPVPLYALQKYRPQGPFRRTDTYSAGQLERLAGKMRAYQPDMTVRA